MNQSSARTCGPTHHHFRTTDFLPVPGQLLRPEARFDIYVPICRFDRAAIRDRSLRMCGSKTAAAHTTGVLACGQIAGAGRVVSRTRRRRLAPDGNDWSVSLCTTKYMQAHMFCK